MAKKRMISKQIVDSDDFIDMPLSTQALYMHLIVNADDEGFINSVKRIMRTIGARDDDMRVLISKKFILPFENGVIVIKHWLIHNMIRKDRFTPTVHTEEKKQLGLKVNGSYTLNTPLQSDIYENGNQTTTNGTHRLGKVRLEEYSIVEVKEVLPHKEIIEYLNTKCNTKYRSTGKKTQDLIRARFNDKFTLEDFKMVIDKKVNEWLNTDMQKFLRPETLFSNKFEGYLNQLDNTVSSSPSKSGKIWTIPQSVQDEIDEIERLDMIRND